MTIAVFPRTATPEALMPPTRPPQRLHRYLTPQQEKHVANAVLPALRRPPRKATLGTTSRFQVHGAGDSPKGLPAIITATWWIARVPPCPALQLEELGLLISEDSMQEAQFASSEGDWYDLIRVVRHSKIDFLFYVQDRDTSVIVRTNQEAGGAGNAALNLLHAAQRAGHIYCAEEEHLYTDE